MENQQAQTTRRDLEEHGNKLIAGGILEYCQESSANFNGGQLYSSCHGSVWFIFIVGKKYNEYSLLLKVVANPICGELVICLVKFIKSQAQTNGPG